MRITICKCALFRITHISVIVYFQAVNESLAVSKTDPAAKVYAVQLLDKLEKVSSTTEILIVSHVITYMV